MTPKISIIIPVYHVEEYITMCLQSVANQTMTEGIECIIVDDCGGDKSINIAQQFVNDYQGNIDFKIIHHEKNGGLSVARNTGIEASTGEYIYFLDSDDEITADCIQLMWGMIEKYENVDFVQGWNYSDRISKETKCQNIDEIYLDKQLDIVKHELTFDGNIICAQNKLINRNLIISNNLRFLPGIIHEDNLWTYHISSLIKKMVVCNNRTYYYRINPKSITHNVNIERERYSYSSIVENCVKSIDPHFRRYQKEFILNNILAATQYFNNIDALSHFRTFTAINNWLTNLLLKSYLLSPGFKKYIYKVLVRTL